MLLALIAVTSATVIGCGGNKDNTVENNSSINSSDTAGKTDDANTENNKSDIEADEQNENQDIPQLACYQGNVVSDDFICYQKVDTKNGFLSKYDYDSNWHKTYVAWYESESDSEPGDERYYYNLYSEDDEIPSDKDYERGYLWDERGNQLQEIKDDEIYRSSEYDNDNNLITYNTWRDGKISMTITYTYENGNCILQSNEHMDDGYVSTQNIYYYDDNGNCTEAIDVFLDETGNEYDRNEGVVYTWEYEYDEYGRIISLRAVDPERGGVKDDFEYTYDDDGHLVEMMDNYMNEKYYYISKSEFVHIQ